MKFALLSYRNSENLGDEIQSLAARHFLPRVDTLIDRDFLSEWQAEPGESFGLILNGWFLDRPERWPPPPSVVPLLVSFHIARGASLGRAGLTGADVILHPSMAAYLREWAPVGARDLATLEALDLVDVPAYLSGCMTLTLRRDADAIRGDEVVLVDLPAQLVDRIRSSTDRDIVVTTHRDEKTPPGEARLLRAQQLLDRYQSAHCVLTSRLHAALPCLAYETPVVLVESDFEPGRLDGLRELVHHCSLSDLLAGRLDFDVDEPAPNNVDYLPFRRSLAARVTEFVEELEAGTLTQRPSAVALEDRLNTLWGLLAHTQSDREHLWHRIAELEAEQAALAASPTTIDVVRSARGTGPSSPSIVQQILRRVGVRPRSP